MGEAAPFGSLVRGYRRALGLTQEELAERAGISARAVSDIEREVKHRPRAETVQLLLEALEVPDSEQETFRSAARRFGPPPGAPAGVLPPASIQPSVPPTNLPDEATPFIGRAGEIAAITELVGQREVRLVTLTGTAGTGKTRLALQAGSSLLDSFRDGVFVVSLAPLTDPLLVPGAIAGALGVQEPAGTDLLAALTSFLKERQVLLVLDNYEHLLEATAVVSSLLDACRELHILVTSRIPLHLLREREYPVPPLAVPDSGQHLDLEQVAQYDAVALFVDRARAVRPDFRVTDENASAVAEVCRRLDGLPLAIELAATRIRLFPPPALVQQLSHRLNLLSDPSRDRPSRHQTLRAAIGWSYGLLSEEERTLFARLSVFTGGCSFEAVEAVCDPDRALNSLEGIGGLVEKSLLHQAGVEEARFTMLETIREYAAEKLSEQGDSERLGEEHAAYFLGRAEAVDTAPGGQDRVVQERRLVADLDNIRAALRWLLERGRAEEELRLACAIRGSMATRGERAEEMRWLEMGLAVSDGASPSVRAGALSHLADVEAFDHYERAMRHAEEALVLYQTVGDPQGTAAASLTLAGLALRAGMTERARTLAEGVLRGDRAALHQGTRSYAVSLLRDIALIEDDTQAARGMFAQELATSRLSGDPLGLSSSLGGLGRIEMLEGKYEEAGRAFREAVAIAESTGHPTFMAGALFDLACLDREQGEYDRALARFRECLVLRPREHYWFRTTVLGAMAELAALAGEGERAARLEGAAAAHRERMKMPPLAARERALREKRHRQAREDVGEDAYNRAWEEGRAMSLDQAVAYALGEDGASQ